MQTIALAFGRTRAGGLDQLKCSRSTRENDRLTRSNRSMEVNVLEDIPLPVSRRNFRYLVHVIENSALQRIKAPWERGFVHPLIFNRRRLIGRKLEENQSIIGIPPTRKIPSVSSSPKVARISIGGRPRNGQSPLPLNDTQGNSRVFNSNFPFAILSEEVALSRQRQIATRRLERLACSSRKSPSDTRLRRNVADSACKESHHTYLNATPQSFFRITDNRWKERCYNPLVIAFFFWKIRQSYGILRNDATVVTSINATVWQPRESCATAN